MVYYQSLTMGRVHEGLAVWSSVVMQELHWIIAGKEKLDHMMKFLIYH